MTSKTYGPLEVNETNEYDIESLQETKETKEKEPIVRGKFMVSDKFMVIEDLDKEHLMKIEIKRIKIRLFTFLIIILVTLVGVWLYNDEMIEDDKFKEYQKPNMYNADIMEGMSARIMGHHQRRRQCGDYAALIDGASRFQRVRFIVIPHLYPVATFIMLICLMDNFRVFEPIIGFSAEGVAQSLSWMIYQDLRNENKMLFGSAGATSMLTIIGIAILLTPVLLRTWKEFRTER